MSAIEGKADLLLDQGFVGSGSNRALSTTPTGLCWEARLGRFLGPLGHRMLPRHRLGRIFYLLPGQPAVYLGRPRWCFSLHDEL
jgi:hypothetical protein